MDPARLQAILRTNITQSVFSCLSLDSHWLLFEVRQMISDTSTEWAIEHGYISHDLSLRDYPHCSSVHPLSFSESSLSCFGNGMHFLSNTSLAKRRISPVIKAQNLRDIYHKSVNHTLLLEFEPLMFKYKAVNLQLPSRVDQAIHGTWLIK